MMIPSVVRSYFEDLTPAAVCQAFYILGATAVLGLAATPDSLQRRLTQYGARSPSTSPASASDSAKDDAHTSVLIRIVTCVTSKGNVPHSWFIHFYIVSLSCTIFWAFQLLSKGTALNYLVSKQASKSAASMTMNQVVLVWVLMGLQGGRRLFESLTILRRSSSRMWFIHWLLGIGFYLCTSVSIWIEGSGALMRKRSPAMLHAELPSLRSVQATTVFLMAWYMQFRCHRQLASLKKYSLPQGGLFQYLVCPHYTCECLLYLSLAILAAPQGQSYNQTLICAVLFVSANLGLTAHGTKQWYSEKFGSQVDERWKMIPYVF